MSEIDLRPSSLRGFIPHLEALDQERIRLDDNDPLIPDVIETLEAVADRIEVLEADAALGRALREAREAWAGWMEVPLSALFLVERRQDRLGVRR